LSNATIEIFSDPGAAAPLAVSCENKENEEKNKAIINIKNFMIVG